MFSNPTQMVGLMQNIGDKIDKKIKSGDLKESELMEEAMDMLGKMKDMPGMKQFEQMFNKFGGKMDLNAVRSQLNSKLNQSKTKERLQAKLKKKQAEPVPEEPKTSENKKKKKKKNKKNIHDPVLDKQSVDPSE
jgi:hypothetical protein